MNKYVKNYIEIFESPITKDSASQLSALIGKNLSNFIEAKVIPLTLGLQIKTKKPLVVSSLSPFEYIILASATFHRPGHYLLWLNYILKQLTKDNITFDLSVPNKMLHFAVHDGHVNSHGSIGNIINLLAYVDNKNANNILNNLIDLKFVQVNEILDSQNQNLSNIFAHKLNKLENLSQFNLDLFKKINILSNPYNKNKIGSDSLSIMLCTIANILQPKTKNISPYYEIINNLIINNPDINSKNNLYNNYLHEFAQNFTFQKNNDINNFLIIKKMVKKGINLMDKNNAFYSVIDSFYNKFFFGGYSKYREYHLDINADSKLEIIDFLLKSIGVDNTKINIKKEFRNIDKLNFEQFKVLVDVTIDRSLLDRGLSENNNKSSLIKI